MRKRVWKKLTAVVLALVLCVQLLPMTALAALLDNDPAYNREILSMLESVVGSEDEAERYYAILQQYGLLDEDGNMPESWDIWMDGKQVTLEEIEALLDSGEYDPDHTILVDNTAITLGNLKTILEIEDYLAYLQEKYFDGHQWTAEQTASLQSLMDQINSEGIAFFSLDDGSEITDWPSNVSHEARVTVTAPTVSSASTSNQTATFTVNLTGALEGQVVSFDYAALSGSQPVAANQTGSITMTADANGAAQTTIQVTLTGVSSSISSTSPVRSSVDLVYYLNLSNLKNALFANGKTATSVLGTVPGNVADADMPRLNTGNVSGVFTIGTPVTSSDLNNLNSTSPNVLNTATLTTQQKNAIAWGVVNQIQVEDGLLSSYDFLMGMLRSAPNTGSGTTKTQDLKRTSLTRTDVADAIKFYQENSNKAGATLTGEYFSYSTYAKLGNKEYTGGTLALNTPTQWNSSSLKATYTAGTPYPIEPMDVSEISYALKAQRTYTCTPTLSADGKTITLSTSGSKSYYTSYQTTVKFTDTKYPAITSVTAPAGTYYPGQIVPVTVTYSEPVFIGSASAVFNGSNNYSISPVGRTSSTLLYSNVLVYPYEVQAVDNASLTLSYHSGSTTDLSSKSIDRSTTFHNYDNYSISGVKLETPNHPDAITGVTAAIDNPITDPVLKASITFANDEDLTQWIDFSEGDNGEFVADDVYLLLDGETKIPVVAPSGGGTVTGATLTMEVPLDLITDGNAATHYLELVVDDELVIGKYDTVSQASAVFIENMDAPTLSVMDSTGEKEYNYTVEGEGENAKKVIYPQDGPEIKATFTVPTGKTYSFGNANSVTTYDENGDLVNPDAHFVWLSSDTSVANIAADGVITPTGKAGDVTFTITALNGGVAGKTVTSAASDTLHFGTGLTPFLLIPNNKLSSVAGQDVTVFWTSNICDKNGSEPTTFTVTVTKGQGTDPVYTKSVTGTAAAPAASVTVPDDVLKYDYDEPANNKYTVTVTAAYNGKDYEASATIDLASKPAVVTLAKLNTYYITDDTASLNIRWNIENFDRYPTGDSEDGEDASDLFRLLITRDGVKVCDITEPGDGEKGTFAGSCTLDIAPVDARTSDPTSYRTVYTVTIQAKNGTDSTWSYDSFMLYVYDADALKIWVDGKDQNSVTLSNVSEISGMSQAEILALKRDIYLKDIISVNYGDYAWNEIADQIAWASDDNNVATVNYQQGTLYENIENFSYVSYRPTTEFGLSGISDGTATVTAIHKLTGMNDTLDVTVETLKDQLYLFQCYPQSVTTLRYQDSTGRWKETTSDNTGAAAIYEANGIHSDVYCTATVDGETYLGTFYQADLETGEGDWTKLERYPCNNLTLRRAAYAYLYIKNPDGTPYTGAITFRGGVYVDDVYRENAVFGLNGKKATEETGEGQKGNVAQTVTLGKDGKLTILMDQTQWGLDDNTVHPWNKVSYVLEISQGNEKTTYYPMLLSIDATVNEDTFVGSGEAIVNFRKNDSTGKHPFIILQGSNYTNYTNPSNLLDYTGKAGPTDSLPEAQITTGVMWWGMDEKTLSDNPKLQLVTETGIPVATGAKDYTITQEAYPFTDARITQYSVKLNQSTMDGVLAGGESIGIYLDYYADGETLSRHESLPFQLCNMLGMGKVEEAQDISTQLQNMGQYIGTDSSGAKGMDFGDQFVKVALNLVSTNTYSTGDSKMFRIQITPTSDPTKFLGFIEVNVGNMNDKDQVTGVYAQTDTSGKGDVDYLPGLNELMVAAGKRSFYSYLGDDFNKVLKRQGVRNLSFQLGGYAESLIYYNENSGKWEIQILNGGFNVGGGVSYTWNWNTMVGPVPFTASLTIGGTAEVSMDALSVAYFNGTTNTSGIGNDFLTELRIYLYLRFFAGLGIDYAVVAFKIGIYGQISLDMQFQWLNRPYMDTQDTIINVADETYNNPKKYTVTGPDGSVISEFWQGENSKLAGQHFKIDGQIGLEFVVRVLFFNYEQVLYSYSFNLLNKGTGDWDKIQTNWEANQAAQQAAISTLLGNRSLSVTSVGGQQMMSLNLAPTLESRDYLEDGRVWGDFSIGLFSLDAESALKNLEYNTYPYANPVVSDDGQLVVYLSDMDNDDVADTRAAFATKSGSSYSKGGAIDDGGYGDSQASLSGTQSFAVAAWTRQMESINKDAGATLTDEDQIIMMNSSEIYAGVYTGSGWTTTRLTTNSSADLAPVVATNGSKAIVAWRSVASSGESVTDEDGNSYAGVTNFDERDNILYRIYNGSEWGETQTLYNGTSGAVKGITAAMLDDGTAAVAYTLDSDKSDNTINDREIYYAVIDSGDGEVTRNVRATNDAYLDENPQLTAVTFPSANDEQRFVLGWYTEQAVASDSASTLDAGETETTNTTTSDIRLLDFDSSGIYTQLLPDSISQAADAYDVSITPTFRFTKNSDSINDLSILWVERAETTGEDVDVEKDVLKGVKFYTYGQNDEIVSFTGAIDVAEMGAGTLIDHFDAYVSDKDANEIKAVILGTTYGADGVITKTAETVGGDTVSYTTPSRATSMYTATETYSDKIDVPAILPEYATIKKGAATQILFTIDNNGIHAVSKLDITVGGTTTTYDDLNLLPGSSIQLWADYQVPETDVEDPAYTVTATFNENQGATGSAETGETSGFFSIGAKAGSNVATGTVYLDLPDVEITDAKIVEEVEGERTIQIKLNNDADATLTKSNRSVKIGFYTDATYETPFPEGYELDPITINENSDLTMLNEGGYSVQTTFEVGRYLTEELSTTENPLTEIPDSGITVYMKAEVLEEGEVLPEPIYSNNYAAVTCENLKTRTGRNVSVTSSFAVEDGNTVVTAYLQNNRLSEASTGNVIVALLDKDDKVIAQQQSYTGDDSDNGLITLDGEERTKVAFTFEGVTNAVKAQVVYSDLIIGADNANLASLRFSNIPVTLENFEAGEDGIYRAAVSTDDLTYTTVTAVTESSIAKASASSNDGDAGGSGNAINETVTLNPGEINTITVTVHNGTESKTYILTVQNNGEPVVQWPDETDALEVTYGTSVYYAADRSATINLTASATPDEEEPAYKISYQWYSCDVDGGNMTTLEDQTASTLTIPAATDVGVYYYRCEVIRHMVDNKTTSYWSSVASVQINKAAGNSVTLEGTEVTFDNQSHGLTGAEAEKDGSTLYYSTDGGKTWSETAPTFTSVGVHTVWVYAANHNYVDTAVMTADVVIQEKSGTLFKLETLPLAETYPGYPYEIRKLYGDADSLSDALTAAMKKMNVAERNIAVCGVKLMFSLDDGATWTEATAENFPAVGMTVTVPYPEGTDRFSYNFILKRLVTDPLNSGKAAGAVEPVGITLTQDGISFTADCLSALVLGWYLRPTADPKYTVAVEDPEHGTVTVSSERAVYNSTVTITAKPDDGYKVGSVTVTAQNGQELTVTDKGNDTYTFKMPYGSASVKVTFVPETYTCDGGVNCPSRAFIDLSTTAWYHEAVDYVLINGLMGATGDGVTFDPYMTTTRGMLMTILARMNGVDTSGSSPWYQKGLDWAVAAGVSDGTNPGEVITREQLAVMLWRYVGSPAATRKELDFTDAYLTHDWALDAMLWATENGIVNGSGGLLNPRGSATRVEVAQMLKNFMEKT